MQSSFYNLKTYLYRQKQYDISNSSVDVIPKSKFVDYFTDTDSTSLIAVGKSFDKLVKARDVKVSTKQWRDGSQTQRYGRSVWQ